MDIEVHDERFRAIVEPDARVERVATGFKFTEGPVWDPVGKRVIFSDMQDDHMRAWSPATGTVTFRKPSNKTNGNVFDQQGRLISCEHATSRVVRQEADGRMTVLASHFQGKALNSPNDIVVKSDGSIYFTDPTFGRIREDVGVPRPLELSFRGVYRIPTGGGPLQLLADDFEQPNGLCFSSDESTLWVNDTVRKHIRKFRVNPDGSLSGGEVFAQPAGDKVGPPDGMKIDSAGHLYCTGPGGLHVFDMEGRCLGVILTPERLTNFNWGDEDLRGLYMTALTSLCRVRVKVPGRPPY